jgi:RND family efflux transporter MFP subunit
VTRLLAIVLTALSLLATACGESESAREAKAMQGAIPQRLRPDGSIQLTPEDKTALGLVVAPAADADLPESVLRFGRVLSPPTSEGQVVSPVTGRVVGAPAVQLGSAVRSGATLIEIMPVLDTPERISVGTQSAEREAQIEATERELTKAEADAARALELAPQIVSAARLQEAETLVATLRARLEGLRNARTATAQAQTRVVPVTAPMSGAVSALNVTVGALVNRGDVLAQIVAGGPLWIDVSVPPDDPVSDRYEVTTPAGPVSARLLARGRVIDPDGTRHDRLVVDAPQASALSPGSTVSLQVARNVSRGIVLPESAVVPGVDGDSVFVETSPGVFSARPIQVAARFGGRVRLASGLKPGDSVVVQGAMGLQGERLRSQLRHVEG